MCIMLFRMSKPTVQHFKDRSNVVLFPLSVRLVFSEQPSA